MLTVRRDPAEMSREELEIRSTRLREIEELVDQLHQARETRRTWKGGGPDKYMRDQETWIKQQQLRFKAEEEQAEAALQRALDRLAGVMPDDGLHTEAVPTNFGRTIRGMKFSWPGRDDVYIMAGPSGKYSWSTDITFSTQEIESLEALCGGLMRVDSEQLGMAGVDDIVKSLKRAGYTDIELWPSGGGQLQVP